MAAASPSESSPPSPLPQHPQGSPPPPPASVSMSASDPESKAGHVNGETPAHPPELEHPSRRGRRWAGTALRAAQSRRSTRVLHKEEQSSSHEKDRTDRSEDASMSPTLTAPKAASPTHDKPPAASPSSATTPKPAPTLHPTPRRRPVETERCRIRHQETHQFPNVLRFSVDSV
ncbi:hypothetical protein NMY22_g13226 [Coprinellus aureogranulatus]|nr:hypothetical protein NMY22_g13226 [Coprinellus aureogranulatus]